MYLEAIEIDQHWKNTIIITVIIVTRLIFEVQYLFLLIFKYIERHVALKQVLNPRKIYESIKSFLFFRLMFFSFFGSFNKTSLRDNLI